MGYESRGKPVKEMKVSSGRGWGLKVEAGVYWTGTLNLHSIFIQQPRAQMQYH